MLSARFLKSTEIKYVIAKTAISDLKPMHDLIRERRFYLDISRRWRYNVLKNYIIVFLYSHCVVLKILIHASGKIECNTILRFILMQLTIKKLKKVYIIFIIYNMTESTSE